MERLPAECALADNVAKALSMQEFGESVEVCYLYRDGRNLPMFYFKNPEMQLMVQLKYDNFEYVLIKKVTEWFKLNDIKIPIEYLWLYFLSRVK